MRKLFRQPLLGEQKGATLVEFALVSPIVTLLAVGLLQMGMLFYASATMRSALGEGARMAKLYRVPIGTWAGPTSTEICSRVTDRIRSMRNATITSLTISRPTTTSPHALLITVNYSVRLHFAFFNKTVPLTSSRQVFVGSTPTFGSPAVACSV